MNGGAQKQFSRITCTNGVVMIVLGSPRVVVNRLQEAQSESRFHRFRQPYYKNQQGYQYVPVFIDPSQVLTVTDHREHRRVQGRLSAGEWVHIDQVIGGSSEIPDE